MNFFEAVWCLVDNGATVRPSKTFSNNSRMYYVDHADEEDPPMILSCKAVISMALLLQNGLVTNNKANHTDAF